MSHTSYLGSLRDFANGSAFEQAAFDFLEIVDGPRTTEFMPWRYALYVGFVVAPWYKDLCWQNTFSMTSLFMREGTTQYLSSVSENSTSDINPW